MMSRRQFLSLFLCSLIPWWVGSGLMPLLPLNAARLGASPALVGNYLSFVFFALAVGTVLGGWLSAKISRYRELLMWVGIISTPATWLMGQVTAIWQLVLLNATVWFVIGISLALITIIAGQGMAKHERGRIFGLLAMTSALGGVLGGPSGSIVDQGGYPLLFALAASLWPLQILAASFLVNPKKAVHSPKPEQPRAGSAPLASTFLLLLSAALLFSTGGFAGTLARSLAMEAQGFPSATITWIAALGSGIGLLVSPLLGRLSDRVDRRWLLCLIYLAGGLALVVMAYSSTPIEFMIVAVLTAVSGAERAISSALVSDVLPAHALSHGLSLFDGIKWIGGVVGLAGTGYVIQLLGLYQALMVSALLPLLALSLLFFLRMESRAIQSTGSSSLQNQPQPNLC